MLVFVVGLTSPLQASTDSFSKVVDDTSRAVAYIISTASTVDPNTPYNKFLKEDQKTQIACKSGLKEGQNLALQEMILLILNFFDLILYFPYLRLNQRILYFA